MKNRRLFRAASALLTAAVLTVQASAARMLIPVGEVVGMSLAEGSVTVAAFHDTLGAAAREAGISIGDEILTVDGRQVDSAADLCEALKRSDGTVEVELCREGKTRRIRLSPTATAEGPRLGIYVREGITGIGTVTYYDPQSETFGALGHGISDSRGDLAPMDRGWVYSAAVEQVRPGRVGAPGQLKGAVDPEAPIGTLKANTPFGVFGSGALWSGEPLPAAEAEQVKPGPAQILANVTGEERALYDVQILRCFHRTPATGRDMLLKVTDPDLLQATGGIVAGMSGSPIIQDGKLIGAVTHVLVNDPTTGYGIFIENMLDAAA